MLTLDTPAPPAHLVFAGRGRQALTIDPALVIVEHELPQREAPGSRWVLALEQVMYCIRLPERPGETECARCGELFPAAGPTGHANEEPICDLCLLECTEELGMVLALVAVARAFAVSRFAAAEEHWEALEELGAFARVYELVASRSGPPRLIVKRPVDRDS